MLRSRRCEPCKLSALSTSPNWSIMTQSRSSWSHSTWTLTFRSRKPCMSEQPG